MMTKLSNLTSGKSIKPGTQIIKVISTENANGNSAAILRAIAVKSSNISSSRVSGDFPDQWDSEGDGLAITGNIFFNGTSFPLTLKIAVRDSNQEGIVLEDAEGSVQSMKPQKGSNVLKVGKKLPAHALDGYANELIGCWVVHGERWYNRAGHYMSRPYGLDARNNMPEQLFFNVIDGEQETNITLADLIAKGCIRSTHVGEWKARHSTLIAAACDMPVTLHEVKDGGEDVCYFNGVKISPDTKVWGPYCSWDESVRRSGRLGMWHDLALRSSTPFAFHVHATRTLFPKARLDSEFILENNTEDKLRGILTKVVQEDPERFYRMVDEYGNTHRLSAMNDDYLFYGNHQKFPKENIPENMIETFRQFEMIQAHPATHLAHRPCIIADTHFYLVLEALMQRSKSVYALSGRDMH